MQRHEIQLTAADGLKLFGRQWEPDTPPRSVVCLVHGLGEHGGRYDQVAKTLCASGIALFAFDLPGHGRSEGRRGDPPDYAVLMDHIALQLNAAAEHHPGLPLFLFGHSLGGNLVLYYALRRQPEIAGLVATAPLLHLAYQPPAWQSGLLKLLYTLRIRCTLPSGLDDTALSRDINVVRTYRNDPLTHSRISPRLAVQMQRAGAWILGHAAELPCPLLLMHGSADRITSADAAQEFAAAAGGRCTLTLWPGLYHELHHEPEKDAVINAISAWMLRTVPA